MSVEATSALATGPGRSPGSGPFLRTRLRRVTVVYLLSILGFSALAMIALERAHRDFHVVADGTLPVVKSLEKLRYAAARIVGSTSELAFVAAGDAERVEAEEAAEIREAVALYEATLDDYRGLVQREFPGESHGAGVIGEAGEKLLAASERVVALAEARAGAPALLEAREALEAGEQDVLDRIGEALASEDKELRERHADLGQLIRIGDSVILAVGALMMLATLVMGRYLRRQVALPVESLTRSVQEFARTGRSRFEVHADGEVGVLASSFQALSGSLDRTTVSRDFLDGILASMNDALLVVDRDGRLTLVNEAACALLEYPEGTLDGLHVGVVTDCDETLRGQPLYAALCRMASENTAELQAASGASRPVSLTVSPLPGGGAVLLAQDVSGLLAVQSDLREARDRAEAAAHSKSLFLANMSHEIRTPLNGMLGMVELMAAGELDVRQADYARTAQRSGEALLAVINDILDFSKMEAGFLEVNEAVFSISDLVEDVGSMFADSARRKDLELVVDLDPEVPECVTGDCPRLRQVLINLVGNAVKFTETCEVVLAVHRVQAAEDGVGVRFRVRDTGIGIPPQHQAHIFDAFAQADGTTTRRFGGTGLGLAISSALVELMGGSLGVDSEPGRGACFEFTLTLAADVCPAGTPPPPGEALRGTRVLVVDDNATNRTVLAHQLEHWGAHAEVAGGGVSALELMQRAAATQGRFDLAVLDRHMPGMDGLALAREIRASEAFGEVKLVVLSSIADQIPPDLRDALGIDCHLSKPVHGRELARALDAVVRGVGAGRADTASRASDPLRGHVLVAEDHPVNQENAREMLALLGLEVSIVDDGHKALEAAITGGFDLVLMDWQMPEMDGLEAVRRIREHEATTGSARLPVVAVTANALDGDRETCLAAGMDDYVSKPFRLAALRDVLSRWLDAPSSGVSSGIGSDLSPKALGEPVDEEPAGASAAGDPVPAQAADGVAAPGPGPHTDRAAPGIAPGRARERDPGALDPGLLAEIADLDRQSGGRFGARLFGSFLDNAPGDLKALREAVAAGDAEAVRCRAHALKGASANVGARGLSALCLEIEAAAREGALEALPPRMDAAAQGLARVLDALAALRRDAA